MEVRLLSSKARVAPIKQQTIPRLELLGAMISARLVSTLLKSLPCEIKPTFWVDSTAALCWIRHDKPWKQYIQSRVQEIRKIVPEASWKHCSGDKNPADLPLVASLQRNLWRTHSCGVVLNFSEIQRIIGQTHHKGRLTTSKPWPN